MKIDLNGQNSQMQKFPKSIIPTGIDKWVFDLNRRELNSRMRRIYRLGYNWINGSDRDFNSHTLFIYYPSIFRSSSPIRILSISFWIHRNNILDIHNIPYHQMDFLV